MELLLKKDSAGNVIAGSEKALIESVSFGDDILLHINTNVFSEHIILTNFLLNNFKVYGLSLKHLGGGLNSPDTYSDIRIVQYIYSSDNIAVICKNLVTNPHSTKTTVFNKIKDYYSYSWYLSQRYKLSYNDNNNNNIDNLQILQNYGDKCKCIVKTKQNNIHFIIKPDIIYFNKTEYVVKSSSMLLPLQITTNGIRMCSLLSNSIYNVYMHLSSKGLLTMMFKNSIEPSLEKKNTIGTCKIPVYIQIVKPDYSYC